MPCHHIPVGGGRFAIACSRGQRVPKCWCKRPGVKRCDWKVGAGKTCDIARCERHSTHVAADRDLCEDHAEKWAAQLELFYTGTLQGRVNPGVDSGHG